MALYDYTLTPIATNITQSEFEAAQLELFDQTNTISPKIWAILAAVAAVGVGGIVYFSGASTLFFWLLLLSVVLYLLFKFVGLKWYVKRELAKQDIPAELSDMKLGLQPHGLVIGMPQSMAMAHMQQQMGGGKQGKSMMTMMRSQQMGGTIGWKDITDYKETPNYYVVMFNLKGQEGSQIIPKRLKNNRFPIDKLAEHLKNDVKK